MPRSQQIVRKFSRGETSPSVRMRTDSDEYNELCEIFENCYVDKRGGGVGRPGARHMGEAGGFYLTPRLIPFIYNSTDSYALEFGNYYVRFYKDAGVLIDGDEQRVSYIASGVSGHNRFFYPGNVQAPDIGVYQNGTLRTITTHYTVTPVSPGQLLSLDPAHADWTKSTAGSDPSTEGGWTTGLTSATSDGQGICTLSATLSGADHNGDGSPHDFSFSVDNGVLTPFDVTYPDIKGPASIPDDGEFATFIQADLLHDSENLAITATIEVDVPVGTGNAYFQLMLNNVVVASSTEAMSAGTNSVTLSYPASGIMWKAGTTILLQAHCDSTITGATLVEANTDITVTATNASPTVTGRIKNATGVVIAEKVVTLDSEALIEGVDVSLPGGVYAKTRYPVTFEIEVSPGASLEIDTAYVGTTYRGYFVEFVTDPAAGDIIEIADVNFYGTSTEEKLYFPRVNAIGSEVTPTVFEIPSPFAASELNDLYYAGANDQLWVCHVNHKPWTLTRNGLYDWTWEQATYTGAPWEAGGYDPADGYPRCVTFFQERLVFAGTIDKPQTTWLSRAASFYDFTVPAIPQGDDPLEYTIAATTNEAITWLSSELVLVLGTSASEHRLAPDVYLASDRLPLVSKMTDFGGAHQQPVVMGDLTSFIQTSGKQFRSFKRRLDSFVEDYESLDLGWMADHLFRTAIKEAYYALIPDAYAVMVRLDGVLLTATYDPTMATTGEAKIGWGRHVTDGNFKSCCVTPTAFRDQVWLVTERVVNGETKTFIEFFDPDTLMDSAIVYPAGSTATDTLKNLDHLEGKTVQIFTSEGMHSDLVVTNGQVVLDYPVTAAAVGLKFTPTIKTGPFDAGNPSGTARGQQKRWVNVSVELVDSVAPLINGTRVKDRAPSTPLNSVQPLINGGAKSFNAGIDSRGQVTIAQDLPVNFHVLGIYGDYHVGNG